ncbi:MAG TPA: OB-fold nucleic acid binding domain-containing protein [archaeon]|nr:OB-fold nucleic acid binding domain-containing protein [archaeon]
MDIIQKILSSTGLGAEEVERRILEKQRELSDLVSREGAAFIVAKELGLDLIDRQKNYTKISDLKEGDRALNFVARISRIFEPKEFEREGKKSKVASLFLLDESGQTRLTLWDRQAEVATKVKVGDAVEVSGAYVKANNGAIEVRLGNRANIKLLETSALPKIEELLKAEKKEFSVENLHDGATGELRAAVVQVFDNEQFYEICPQCSMRIKEVDGKYNCKTHGEIAEPSLTLVISCVVDDGTGNVRAVFFRDSACKLLGMDMPTVLRKRGKLFRDVDLAGKEFLLTGRARKNQMFERLEFIVSDFREANAKEEIGKILSV